MSGFSVDWLNLREPADRRARDRNLLKRAIEWLQNDASMDLQPRIVDLGAGTGSTLRAFAAAGDRIRWRLVDQDPVLLDEACRRHGASSSLETCPMDLVDVSKIPLNGARLVTASALLDLVSAPFVDALAGALRALCSQQPVSLYAALNYDGTTRWTPSHPLDEAVLEAFNRDQCRDKGFGPALGPDASDRTEKSLRKVGFQVSSASSPWVLEGPDAALVRALAQGIATAVEHDSSLESTEIRDWLEFRLANASIGRCVVGHRDLLAIPSETVS